MGFQDRWEATPQRFTNMTIQEEVESALSVLLSSDLRSILRKMAIRYPNGFLEIVRNPNEVEAPTSRPPKIYRTPEEFEQNPDLMKQCADIATEWIYKEKVISAIKAVREVSGLGLKEAKDFVESLPACANYYRKRDAYGRR